MIAQKERVYSSASWTKTNFPAWDNLSFSWSTTPPNDIITTLTLWLQDQASNVSWGYPFHIQYDNQTPSSPASFELVNLVTSAGQLQATLKLNTSSSEYPLFFLITDNDAQPDPLIRAGRRLIREHILELAALRSVVVEAVPR